MPSTAWIIEQLALPYINANDAAYGAIGNGVNNDTSSLQAAINAANAQGGGLVICPGQNYQTGKLQMYSGVYVLGMGAGATVFTLLANTNDDMFWGGSTNKGFISPWAANASGNTGGLANFGFANLTLDGNKGNQSGTSNGIDIYGLNWRIWGVDIRNFLTHGALIDWNGGNTPTGQDGMEGSMIDCKFRGNSGLNLLLGGPHDSKILHCTFENSGQHNVYNGPNAVATQFANCHGWGTATGGSYVTFLGDAEQLHFSNCEWEGSDTVQLAMMAKRWTFSGGALFSSLSTPASGLQIGQAAGNTPYKYSNFQTVPGATNGGTTTAAQPNAYRIDTSIYNCKGASGSLWFANDGGGKIDAIVDSTDGTGSVSTGTVSSATDLSVISDLSGSSNHSVRQFSGYTALAQQSNANAQTIATAGTIQPSGVGIVIVTTAGAVTGVIIAAGLTGGQILEVCNKSANTLTMDVPGTSHVADGTSDVIAATSIAAYRWVAGPNLWYRIK